MKEVIKILENLVHEILYAGTTDTRLVTGLNKGITLLKNPCYLTVPKWEAENGEKLGDDALVWVCNVEYFDGWFSWKYSHVKERCWDRFKSFTICVANGPYPPSKNWRPS